MRIPRTLIRRFFSLFGIGLYRLNASQVRKQPAVDSPIYHNTRERLDKFYSTPESVDAYLSPKRIDFYEEVIGLLRERGIDYVGKRIVDVGCGTGYLLHMISEKSDPKSLSGLDFSEEALKIAEQMIPGADLLCSNIYELPDATYDVVFCLEVLEHLLHPQTALRRLIGLLDKKGVAVITVPNGRTDTYRGHINFWSPESWSVFLQDVCTGFEIETGLLQSIDANFAIVRQGQDVQ